MLGRFRHYYYRAHEFYRSYGYFGTARRMAEFLWRRKFLLQFLFEWVEYEIISRKRDLGATVIAYLKSDQIKSLKVLLYASYDLNSLILPHVVQQLQFFKALGYDIVWVSTSPQVPTSEFSKIEKIVTIGIHRQNAGYDFGSWKVGFDKFSADELSSLVIMNDSCLGPEYDFSSQLLQIESAVKNVYGITKSYEIAEYLQSYFIHFGCEVLKNGVARKYFERIRMLHSKWGIVRYFEIGGSRMLCRAGIRLSALADPKDDVLLSLLNSAGSSDLVADPVGRELIKLRYSPFYKRSNLATEK